MLLDKFWPNPPNRVKVKKDAIALGAVVGVALTLPWLFGGTYAAVKALVAVVCLLSAALLLIGRAPAAHQGAPTRPWLLLIFFSLIAVAQLVPLPPAVHRVLAPAGHSVQHDFSYEADLSAWRTVTLDAGLTREEFAFFATLGCLALIGCRAMRGETRTRIVLTCLSVNGGLAAVVGILLKAWQATDHFDGLLNAGSFAAFPNRNAAAGFLNICQGAGIAWLLFALAPGAQPGHRRQGSHRASYRMSLRGEPLLALACLAVCQIAVIATASRGGILSSLMAGMALLTTLIAKREFRVAGGLAAVVALTLSATMWLGLQREIQSRVEQSLTETRSEKRIIHWTYMTAAIPDFWRTGSGIGTYRYVHRLYDKGSSAKWYYHAENQYLETLLNAGILGAALMLAGILSAAYYVLRCISRFCSRQVQAMGYGALFVLVSQLVHAGFDFGLYVPANAFAFSFIMFAAANAAQSVDPSRSASRFWLRLSEYRRLGSRTRCLAELITIGLAVVAVFELSRLTIVEIARGQSRFAATPDLNRDDSGDMDLTDMAVEELPLPGFGGVQPLAENAVHRAISRLETAARFRSYEGRVWLELAHLRLQMFRLKQLQRAQEQQPSRPQNELWKQSSLTVLYAQLKMMNANEREAFRALPEVNEFLVPAWNNLLTAVQHSPLLARAHLLIAEIAPLLEKQTDGRAIGRAVSLAGGEAGLITEAGFLALVDGNLEDSLPHFRRAMMIEPNRARDIIPVLRLVPARPDPESYLPDDPQTWLTAALIYQDDALVKARLVRGALEIIERQRAKLGRVRTLELTAKALRLDGDLDEALTAVSAAVALDPRDVGLRFDLLDLLLRLNQLDEAHAQLDYLKRRVPRDRRIMNFQKRLEKAEQAQSK